LTGRNHKVRRRNVQQSSELLLELLLLLLMLLLLLTTNMMMTMMTMTMMMVALMSVDVVLTWRQTDSVQSSPASATTCQRRTVSQFHRRSLVFFCFSE